MNNVATNTSSQGAELVLMLPWLKPSICRELNERFGIAQVSNDEPQDGDWFRIDAHFVGTYTGTLISANLVNKLSACLQGTDLPTPAGAYHFYHVLIPR